MSWIHVNHSALNEIDIFAFVNLKDDTVLRGRLFTTHEGVKGIALMDTNGAVYASQELPAWTYSSTEENVFAEVMKGLEALPGGDIQNIVFNIERGNYSPEHLSALAMRALKSAIVTPKCVILKYVPDLSLSAQDMESFIFTSELKQY